MFKNAVLVLLLLSTLGFQERSDNGVYGGYVGSDQWFRSWRQWAQNRADLMRLKEKHQESPANFIEAAGLIKFPADKNPFPGGHLPDLRIVDPSGKDPVERAPFIDPQDSSFYTILEREHQYDFYWMYFMGSREKFATVKLGKDSPSVAALIVTYEPGKVTAAEIVAVSKPK